MRYPMLLVSLMLIAFVDVAPVAGHAAVDELRATTVSHGVKLSLAVPDRTYTPNTLAAVQVRMENVSRRHFEVVYSCPPIRSPYARVLDATESVIYPPAVPGAAKNHGCTASNQRVLGPGQSIRRRALVILRGSRLEAFGQVLATEAPRTAFQSVPTRAVAVNLQGTEPAPTARLTRQGDGAEITVTSPVPVRGPLRYQYWFECVEGDFESTPETYTWQRAAGSVIYLAPPAGRCTSVTAWHVVAGWVGHPVVFIDG